MHVSSPKIILIDNDMEFLTATTILLEVKGYEIDAVVSVERCLQKLKRQRYDIAIIDLKMPGLTEPVWGGMDFISTLIRIDPLVQIIVLTGYGSEDHKIEAVNRGAFDFVEKTEHFINDITKAINFAWASKRSIFTRNLFIPTHLGEAVAQFSSGFPYENNVFIMMRYYEGVDMGAFPIRPLRVPWEGSRRSEKMCRIVRFH